MGDLDGAMNAYEQALRHNQWSIPAMNAISCILRTKEQFPKAIEYLQNILKLDPTSGETWGSLGHCHLMMDNLQEAYTSYQQALYHLRDPKVSGDGRCDWLPKGAKLTLDFNIGTQALVRYRYPVRPLWILGPRRRGLLSGHAHGAGV
jgi:tetratricopeptide (TPR) repeat protein